MTSTKPYLIRAFYEWICDNNFTPYIVVNVNKQGVHVPREYVKDGKIVFNIAPGIVQVLEITNEMLSFEARFSGSLRQIYAPVNSVTAIYAKENGRGMIFDEEAGDDGNGNGNEENGPSTTPDSTPKKGKPKLKVVK